MHRWRAVCYALSDYCLNQKDRSAQDQSLVENPRVGLPTARSPRQLRVQVSHKTVSMWIKKYTELMEKYLDKITPQVSDTWVADELFLKVKGNMKYFYALMDDQTRFWIAQEVANTKYTANVRPLLELEKAVAGKKPKKFIADGEANFHDAYMQAFWTLSTPPAYCCRKTGSEDRTHRL